MDSKTHHIHIGSLGKTKAGFIEKLLSQIEHPITISQKFLQLTNDLAQRQPDLLILAADQSTVPEKTIFDIIQTFAKKIPTIAIVLPSFPTDFIDALYRLEGLQKIIYSPIAEDEINSLVNRTVQEKGGRLKIRSQVDPTRLEPGIDPGHETYPVYHLENPENFPLVTPNSNFKGIYSMIQAEIEKIESQLRKRLQPACQNQVEDEPHLSFQVDVPKALSSINSSLNRINYYSTKIILQTLIGRSKETHELINSQIMIDRILQNFAYQIDQHQMHISIKPLPSILSNRASLERVFTILISHAVHTPIKEGRPFLRIWADNEAGFTRFHIKHNGENLIGANESSIFEKPEAHALLKNGGIHIDFDLSMARAIVKNLGGHFDTNSSAEYGTTFSFTLPKGETQAVRGSENHQLLNQKGRLASKKVQLT